MAWRIFCIFEFILGKWAPGGIMDMQMFILHLVDPLHGTIMGILCFNGRD